MIADSMPDQLAVDEQAPRAGRGRDMSFEEFVEELAAALDEASVIRLSPGPIDLKVGEDDVRAIQILRQLLKRAKADLTFGEAEGILIYNAIREMKRVAETAADAPAADDDLSPEAGGPLMANVLRAYNVGAFLTAWWWLVFWTAHDREPKDSSLLPLTPAAIDKAPASPPAYGMAFIVE